VKRGMACDFSWERSAREYLKIYEAAIAAKSGKE
jgi:glycogen synthase